MSDTISDLFFVSVLLIVVVYFVGFSTDLKTVSASLNSLINVATGRNAQGQFANYPTGGK